MCVCICACDSVQNTSQPSEHITLEQRRNLVWTSRSRMIFEPGSLPQILDIVRVPINCHFYGVFGHDAREKMKVKSQGAAQRTGRPSTGCYLSYGASSGACLVIGGRVPCGSTYLSYRKFTK